jgi:hypothetical protein
LPEELASIHQDATHPLPVRGQLPLLDAHARELAHELLGGGIGIDLVRRGGVLDRILLDLCALLDCLDGDLARLDWQALHEQLTQIERLAHL